MTWDEFWDLTWYDWNGWAFRIRAIQDNRQFERDLKIELQRQWMALYANSNRARGAEAFKGEDFFSTSYDKKEPEAEKIDPDVFKEKVKTGDLFKRKNG